MGFQFCFYFNRNEWYSAKTKTKVSDNWLLQSVFGPTELCVLDLARYVTNVTMDARSMVKLSKIIRKFQQQSIPVCKKWFGNWLF